MVTIWHPKLGYWYFHPPPKKRVKTWFFFYNFEGVQNFNVKNPLRYSGLYINKGGLQIAIFTYAHFKRGGVVLIGGDETPPGASQDAGQINGGGIF